MELLPGKSRLQMALHLLVNAGTTMLVGVMFGCILVSFITMHAKAQSSSITTTSSHFNAITVSTDIAVLTTEIHDLKSSVHDLSVKTDKVQSQADITQATGVGIGIAITFLQILGLLVAQTKEK